MRSRTVRAACVVVVMAFAGAPALGQGIELYATTHPFSLPLTTSVRCFAMGNHEACVPDDGFANPAFGGLITAPTVRVRAGHVNFSRGPDLDLGMVSISFPAHESRPSYGGLQVSLYRSASDTATVLLPGAPGPVDVKMCQQDAGIMWGRRVSDKLLVGVGISPIIDAEFNVRMPGSGAPLMLLDSDVRGGARLGAAYEISDGLIFGALYDNYEECVTARGMLVGPMRIAKFRSEQWGAGLSFRPGRRSIIAVELQRYELKGAGTARHRRRTLGRFYAGRPWRIQ